MVMLPDRKTLAKNFQGFSYCDALLMPDWDMRYFSYDAGWNRSKQESMGSIRDGQGLEVFFLFSKEYVIGKVFDGSRCDVSMDSIAELPEIFDSFKFEPAFSLSNVTFLSWLKQDNNVWTFLPSRVKFPEVINVLCLGIEYYHQWAESYYERPIDKQALYRAFDTLTIDEDIRQRLEAELSMVEIRDELKIILG